VADPRILSIVLAGGEGKRLAPLTADRAKPAVPFGGHYRIVDFVLSNLANAGYLKIVVLTQYKSHSLDLHITRTWRLSTLLGSYVTPVPAQMRRGPRWFAGSADAIYQNLNLVVDEDPDYILVFGADHIYRMDPRDMVSQHIASGAGVTVAGIRVPRQEAHQYGVIEVGEGNRIARFTEKPAEAEGLPDAPDQIYASMGNYVFTRSTLVEAVSLDAEEVGSRHDVGGNVIPAHVAAGEARVYDFTRNHVPGETERDHAYWRDVGTLDSYYDAHMDLVSIHPVFNLYNRRWPIYTSLPTMPPAKFVLQGEATGTGQALDSMVCAGSIISGGTVRSSVISPGVLVGAHAVVEESVLMHDVNVGAGAVVRRAIVDKNVQIPPGARIGVDPAADRARFTVSANGIVVIGKGEKVPEA
jgi:glucose-1-phosphate adenylyltransferase